ncbi:TPA: hypothetical protein N0F65_012572 [Lagenidium giganteum]|uniref:Uncharacterized protein n=1 Tax=Lagenidium giganteum TaxID=4803 RepID=A0AAV2YQ48_9STRA|nr:TPA: hypothetical protein N0F65_012572 [Lagenidium giganteum]
MERYRAPNLRASHIRRIADLRARGIEADDIPPAIEEAAQSELRKPASAERLAQEARIMATFSVYRPETESEFAMNELWIRRRDEETMAGQKEEEIRERLKTWSINRSRIESEVLRKHESTKLAAGLEQLIEHEYDAALSLAKQRRDVHTVGDPSAVVATDQNNGSGAIRQTTASSGGESGLSTPASSEARTPGELQRRNSKESTAWATTPTTPARRVSGDLSLAVVVKKKKTSTTSGGMHFRNQLPSSYTPQHKKSTPNGSDSRSSGSKHTPGSAQESLKRTGVRTLERSDSRSSIGSASSDGSMFIMLRDGVDPADAEGRSSEEIEEHFRIMANAGRVPVPDANELRFQPFHVPYYTENARPATMASSNPSRQAFLRGTVPPQPVPADPEFRLLHEAAYQRKPQSLLNATNQQLMRPKTVGDTATLVELSTQQENQSVRTSIDTGNNAFVGATTTRSQTDATARKPMTANNSTKHASSITSTPVAMSDARYSQMCELQRIRTLFEQKHLPFSEEVFERALVAPDDRQTLECVQNLPLAGSRLLNNPLLRLRLKNGTSKKKKTKGGKRKKKKSGSAKSPRKKTEDWPVTLHRMQLGRRLHRMMQDLATTSAVDSPGKHRIGSALQALGVPVVEWKDYLWETQTLPALETYKALCGDLLVKKTFVVPYGNAAWPRSTWSCRLGLRVQKLRAARIELDPEHQAALERLNFVWRVADAKWHDKFLPALRIYHQLHGDVAVPTSFVVPSASTNDAHWPAPLHGYRLGQIVQSIRIGRYAALVQLHRDELDALGFVWDPLDHRWRQVIFPALQHYFQLHGHTVVPRSFVVPDASPDWPPRLAGVKLGEIVPMLRRGHYSTHVRRHAAELSQMGFAFSVREKHWSDVVLPALEAFAKDHGHCSVPYDFRVPAQAPYPPTTWGFHLGGAVSAIRSRDAFKKQVQRDSVRLEQAGFAWRAHLSLEDTIEHKLIPALEAHQHIVGHALVPTAFVVPASPLWPSDLHGFKLGQWVQRVRSGTLSLPPSLRASITSAGFVWDHRQEHWDQVLLPSLRTFAAQNGSCAQIPPDFRVPQDPSYPVHAWGTNLAYVPLAAENTQLREELRRLQAKYDQLHEETTKKIHELIDENEILADANRLLMENKEVLDKLQPTQPEPAATQVPDELLLPGNGLSVTAAQTLREVHGAGNLLCVATHNARPALVVTGGVDKHAVVHDWRQQRKLCAIEMSAPVLSLSFNPSPALADYFVAACMDGKCGLYKLVDHDGTWRIEELQVMHDHTRHGGMKAVWSTTGELFATGSSDKSVHLYKCKDLAATATEPPSCDKIKSFFFNGTVESMVFVPPGDDRTSELLAIAVRDDCYVHYVDLATLEKERVNMNQDGIEHVSYAILDLRVSPSGKYLLAATDKSRHFVFGIKSNIVYRNFYGHEAGPYSQPRVVWDSSEKYIISNTERGGVLYVWCMASERVIDTIEAHEAMIRDIAMSSDNTLLSVSYDKSCKAWACKVAA